MKSLVGAVQACLVLVLAISVLPSMSRAGYPAEVGPGSGVRGDLVRLVDLDTEHVIVDDQPMRLLAVDKPYAFSNPSRDTFRFEVRKNDFGWRGDARHGNRRSELVSEGRRYHAGQTLWSSFSFVVGPEHVPFDPEGDVDGHGILTQWHSVDYEAGRAPVFTLELLRGNLEIATRSDADLNSRKNGKTIHYSDTRPPDGDAHSVVIAGRLGQDGHLTVWLDGNRIVDKDTPIGYYNDVTAGRPRALAYPQWGIYQKNVDEPAIVYHSNIEWGLVDLSSRIANPLAVAAPPSGWV